MTAIATLPVLLQAGTHAARPAASAVGSGALYNCTTHGLIYQQLAGSWGTWLTLPTAGMTDPMTTRGDIIIRNASNVTARLAKGSAGTYLGSDGTDVAYAAVTDAQLSTSDVTTNNVVSTKHGFAPKSPADATQFLNGAATPAYAAVKDSDLSTSDITTNNASTSKHGFLKKLSNSATDYMDGTGNWSTPSGGGGSLANESHQLGSDFTVAAANTFGDVGLTTTALASGTWLLIATCTVQAPGGASTDTIRIWDGTTVYASSGPFLTAGTTVEASVVCLVTGNGSLTFRVSMAAQTNGGKMLAASPLNSAGNNASTLVAIQIA